ncbi:hypothetical protein [Microvirga solisilvae]|uniref:hypothetical protein n=1 Tax=Microvirga solisilvae TaxID=2919498 RepID=UPI001FB011F2|nr:hypothetical protein [Microvirga solisilvae]
MTNMQELKQRITDTWRDEEMSSSACYGVDAYARLWPYVFFVNDWDVWTENGKDLKATVYSWLNRQNAAWDFYHLQGGWGLIGFKDKHVADHFKLRWSGAIKAVPSSEDGWNPHPTNSCFAYESGDEEAQPIRALKRARR